jgi:CheY-like chemotaxis protein
MKTIVLVDDSADLVHSYREILSGEGYRCLVAGSGPDALDLLDRIEIPDLLLLDCRMPEMSGDEFLRVLRRRRPDLCRHCRIVGFTALDQESSLVRALRDAAIPVFEKPDEIDGLVKLVRSAIGDID